MGEAGTRVRGQSGFLLVEAMVTVVLMGLALVGLLASMTVALRSTQLQTELVQGGLSTTQAVPSNSNRRPTSPVRQAAQRSHRRATTVRSRRRLAMPSRSNRSNTSPIGMSDAGVLDATRPLAVD